MNAVPTDTTTTTTTSTTSTTITSSPTTTVPETPVGNADRVYWVNYGLGRIDAKAPDGTGLVTGVVTTGVNQPRALDVDAAHLYWINNDSIGRSDTDGSNQEPNFITGNDGTVSGIAVTATHIYWTTFNGHINRSDIDGTDSTTLVSGASLPYDIVATNNHLYWTEQAGGTLGISDLDGSNANHSFVTNAGSAYGIAATATHLYWGSWGSTGIGRVELDGTNADPSFIPAQCNVAGVAVDATSIYWANACDGTIRRADLDGTNLDTTFVTGASDPAGVAVHFVSSSPSSTTTSTTSSTSSTTSTTLATSTTSTSAPTTTSTTAPTSTTSSSVPALTEDSVLALPQRPLSAGGQQITAGERVRISGSGFVPGEIVDMYIASTPILLGSTIADANGVATIEAVIPAGLEPGAHSLVLHSPSSGIGFRQTVTLTTDATTAALPTTGRDPSRGVLLALLLLASGAMLSLAAQRRSRS